MHLLLITVFTIVLPLPFAQASLPESFIQDVTNSTHDITLRAPIEACLRRPNASSNPDHIHFSGTLLPRSIEGFLDVVQHRGRSSNSDANNGIISYMSDSVASDEQFFMAAFRFYSELQNIDRELRRSGRAPYLFHHIQSRSPIDLFSLAMRHAHNDNYLALRIMALFGHDDTRAGDDGAWEASLRTTTENCRMNILRSIAPRNQSVLYSPGSLSGLGYSESQIRQAAQIARDCHRTRLALDESQTFSVGTLCNDDHINYLADYYHVITAAFLSCRMETLDRQYPDQTLLAPLRALRRPAYLQAVQIYKISRFRDAVAELIGRAQSGHAPFRSINIVTYLNQVLAALTASRYSPLPDPPLLMSREERDFAQAVVRRYLFEIDFRLYQHDMGMRFGSMLCANRANLEACPVR